MSMHEAQTPLSICSRNLGSVAEGKVELFLMNELTFPHGPLNSSDPSLSLHYTSPRAANENAAIHLLALCGLLPEYDQPKILRETED